MSEKQNWWEAEGRIGKLTAMWQDGNTSYVIAEELGCTRNAVMGKVNRLGLQRGKATEPSTPTTEPRPKTPKPKRVTDRLLFEDTRHRQCRYPLWGVNQKTGHVCGKRTVSPSSSWCSEHLRIISSPIRPRTYSPPVPSEGSRFPAITTT